jgi:VanZ family protein
MRRSIAARRSLLRWLPALGWMAVIFLLSAQGGLRVSEDPGVDRPLRIVAHLATFGLLGALVLFAISGRQRPSGPAALAAVGVTLLYALSDELHQALVPGRTGRLDDVVVDLVGAVAGVVVAAIILTRLAEAGSGDELGNRHFDAERQHS